MLIRESESPLSQHPPDADSGRVCDLDDSLEGWLNMLSRKDARHTRLSHADIDGDQPLLCPARAYRLPESFTPVRLKGHFALLLTGSGNMSASRNPGISS